MTWSGKSMRARPTLLIAISTATLALAPLGVAVAGASTDPEPRRTTPVTSLVSKARIYPAYLAVDLRGIERVLPPPPAPKPVVLPPKPVVRPAKVAAPPPVITAAAIPVPGFIWPVRGQVISNYGPRDGRRHEGTDIGAPIGTPVVAPRGGTVVMAGTMSGYGLVIDVDHGDGLTTRYAHLSRMDVGVGQTVGQGQQLGAVGMTGRTSAPHLHFEVRLRGVPQNPMNYLP